MSKYNKSDTMEDIEFLKELNVKQRNDKEPGRREYIIKTLKEMGYEPTEDVENKCILFSFQGNTIRVYPYTGWFTGKGIKDGRGTKKLFRQIGK